MEKTINKYFDICIIGGGAAGMVAGIAAARKNPSLSVVIVEKMEAPGKKVAAAGNGRREGFIRIPRTEGMSLAVSLLRQSHSE